LTSVTLSEPHDDHCTLVYGGQLWWIVSKAGDYLLVTNEIGKFVLDLSAVDWEAYLAAAERSLREHFPEAAE
jgi:hypothetical protein